MTVIGSITAVGIHVPAEGTLTLAVQPTDGDTMLVDGKTYTFEDSLTNFDGNINIGGSLAVCKLNLVAAFDLSGTPGTDYATDMTAHTTVDIATFIANDAVLTAKVAGTAGNSIVTTETFFSGSNIFDDATLGTTQAGTDATLIVQPGNGGFVTFANRGANPVFLGGPEVLTTDGYEMAVDDTITLQMTPNEAVYGVVAASTEDVHSLEVS